MSFELRVQTECSLRCSYRFVAFEKCFNNECEMLASSVHKNILKINENKTFLVYKYILV